MISSSAIKPALVAARRRRRAPAFAFLTETITSPTLAEQIALIQQAFPQAKWHQWDPVARDARAPRPAGVGADVDAIYHFDKADVDRLARRRLPDVRPGDRALRARLRALAAGVDRRATKDMNRLYAIESTPTLTGAKADHRLPLRASEIEAFARALAGALGVGRRRPRTPNPQPTSGSTAVAKDLQAHRGRSLVVAGDYQPAAVHALAHAINQALGNVGDDSDLLPRRRSQPDRPARVAARSRRRPWTPARSRCW